MCINLCDKHIPLHLATIQYTPAHLVKNKTKTLKALLLCYFVIKKDLKRQKIVPEI